MLRNSGRRQGPREKDDKVGTEHTVQCVCVCVYVSGFALPMGNPWRNGKTGREAMESKQNKPIVHTAQQNAQTEGE